MPKNKRIIQLLSDLIAIDSQTAKGNKKIIAFLAQWFKNYDCTIQNWVRDIDDVTGQNLIVKIPGERSDTCLVFLCHMDTVPTNHLWETNPFILEEQGGNLYGLGACDTKGGVAALIEAVFSLTKKPACETYLVFDGDEEETSVGVQTFLKKFHAKNPRFIAIEPTNKEVHIAQRSIIKLNITAFGTARHSSEGTPENNEKKNSIYKMHTIMDVLLQDAKRLSKEIDPRLGTNTQNFGMITGGTARNVFAEDCTLVMERRLLPSRDCAKEAERIKKLVRSIEPKAKIDVVGELEPGFITKENDPFAQYVLSHMQSVVPNAHFGVFPAWAEAGFSTEKGPSVIMGPGSIKQAHNVNEFVSVQELFKFIKIFRKIIEE